MTAGAATNEAVSPLGQAYMSECVIGCHLLVWSSQPLQEFKARLTHLFLG